MQLTPAKTAGNSPAAPKTQFPLLMVLVLTSHKLSSTRGVSYYIFFVAFNSLYACCDRFASRSDQIKECQKDKHKSDQDSSLELHIT